MSDYRTITEREALMALVYAAGRDEIEEVGQREYANFTTAVERMLSDLPFLIDDIYRESVREAFEAGFSGGEVDSR